MLSASLIELVPVARFVPVNASRARCHAHILPGLAGAPDDLDNQEVISSAVVAHDQVTVVTAISRRDLLTDQGVGVDGLHAASL